MSANRWLGRRGQISQVLRALVRRLRRPTPTQAVLVLCHAMERSIVTEFRRIAAALGRAGDCRVILHCRPGVACTSRVPCYVFSDESLALLPYPWLFENKVVPGSTHFPLMEFFSKFPDYEYYWVIEGDVKFSGNWRRFFKAFAASDADFITCYVRRHSDDPEWHWWPTLSHPSREIPLAERIASFNPVYRISKKALRYLHEKHCDGWRGHFEVLIPTLLFHGGLRVQDIGGCSPFIMPGEERRFYTRETFRHQPTFRRAGWKRNKLYHPVKSLDKSPANSR